MADETSVSGPPNLHGEQGSEPPGRPDDATRPSLRDPPDLFPELRDRGLALLELGADIDGARQALERAAAICPEDADVAYGLGVAYGRLALSVLASPRRGLLPAERGAEVLLARAVFSYQRVVDADPGREEAWNGLAALHALRGDRGLAIEALKRSLKACPDQPPVRERLEELGAF